MLTVASRPPAPEPGSLLWYGDDLEAGGAGEWNASAASWWNGETLQAWDPASTAVFAGAGGSVTVAEGITAPAVRFLGEGYRLEGTAESLAGLARIEVAAGQLEIFDGDAAWTLSPGQTLAGEGTVAGSVVFGRGATLSPGRSVRLAAAAAPVVVPEPGIGLAALAVALLLRGPHGRMRVGTGSRGGGRSGQRWRSPR